MRSPGVAAAGRRVVDLSLYVAIGTVVALGIVWGAGHSRMSGAEAVGMWGAWAANTAIVFGFTIYYHIQHIRRSLFWLAVSLLLCAHSLVFLVLFHAVGTWKLGWWALIAPLEYLALGATLALAGYGTTKRERSPRP